MILPTMNHSTKLQLKRIENVQNIKGEYTYSTWILVEISLLRAFKCHEENISEMPVIFYAFKMF